MKPSKLQKELSRIVQSQGKFWEVTNDINSPTHYCDLESEIDNLGLDYPEVSEELLTKFKNSLETVLNIIKSV